tara:strand:- start:3412 stop:4035 length:624 start_codon:yes stop_codon:yes gene_type:complete
MEHFKILKERSDMILEPLQVMIQLGILSFCPIGTKLSISENILYLQEPSFTQGILRWYMNDNKDDLYYLFQAIRRYYQWYKPAEKELFKRILEISMKGIKKLIQTYDKSEKLSIKQTLNLYTNILSLDTPNLFDNNQDISSVNIDTVFKNITKVYTKPLLVVIHNTFRLLELEKSDSNKRIIYNGLQEILRPHNEKIKIWIRENLTC